MAKPIVVFIVVAVCSIAHPASIQAQKLTPEQARAALGAAAEKSGQKFKSLTFEEFKDRVYKEPFDGGKYIVNGDVAIAGRKYARRIYDQNVRNKPPENMGPVKEFAILNVGGLDQIWRDDRKRRLTYCVSKEFADRYANVVGDMEGATAEWEAVSDVGFIHLAQEDVRCDAFNALVVFDVRPVNVGGEYYARAFFPNDLRADLNVLIDNSSFGLDPGGKLSLVGILRHELGHVIGARHEQTRPEAGTCFEDSDWRGITDYDAMSVMHYPQCNGLGDWSLTLTPRDETGAACVYGPAPDFAIDTSLIDIATCPHAPAGTRKRLHFESQILEDGKTRTYGPYEVAAGTRFVAQMTPSGTSPGDPDLFLKFDDDASPTSYDCGPLREDANEECKVDVPAGITLANIAVAGPGGAQYDLEILYFAQ